MGIGTCFPVHRGFGLSTAGGGRGTGSSGHVLRPLWPLADTLTRAPALTFNRKDRLQLTWAADVAGQAIAALPTHYIPSTHGITEAARVGLGWAVNPLPLVQPLFDNGALIRLRPDVSLATELFWQVPRQNKVALAGLTKSLTSYARQQV